MYIVPIDWTEVVPASVKNLIFPLLPTVGYARVYAVDSPHQVSVSRQSTKSSLATGRRVVPKPE